MGKAQLLDGGTVRLGGVGTPYYYTRCITVLCREHCRRVCATWRGSPQVAANTSPGFTKCFHDSGHRRPVSYAFHISIPGFGHRGPLSVCTCGIRALGFGQMLMVLSRLTQPTTPSQFTTKLPQTKYFGSLLVLDYNIQILLLKQHL